MDETGVLFRFQSRGDNNEDSDYDFCVVTSDDYGIFEMGGFFADSRDVLGDDFSREVFRDRKLLYEA